MSTPKQGRGIGVDNRKPKSFAWVALDGYVGGALNTGAIGRIPVDIPDGVTMLGVADFVKTTQVGTLGAGVAIDLDIWGINQGSSSATHIKVDPMGNITAPVMTDVVPLDDNPTLPDTQKPHPYTYSDFTGFGLRNFTNPHGQYLYRQMGCGNHNTEWLKVTWDADTPPGTAVTLRARAADDVMGLASATSTGPYTQSPADLSMMPGPLAPNPAGYLQVQFDLTTSDKATTPRLKSFSIIYECGILVK
jgi:hypothetical protein